MPLKAA